MTASTAPTPTHTPPTRAQPPPAREQQEESASCGPVDAPRTSSPSLHSLLPPHTSSTLHGLHGAAHPPHLVLHASKAASVAADSSLCAVQAAPPPHHHAEAECWSPSASASAISRSARSGCSSVGSSSAMSLSSSPPSSHVGGGGGGGTRSHRSASAQSDLHSLSVQQSPLSSNGCSSAGGRSGSVSPNPGSPIMASFSFALGPRASGTPGAPMRGLGWELLPSTLPAPSRQLGCDLTHSSPEIAEPGPGACTDFGAASAQPTWRHLQQPTATAAPHKPQQLQLPLLPASSSASSSPVVGAVPALTSTPSTPVSATLVRKVSSSRASIATLRSSSDATASPSLRVRKQPTPTTTITSKTASPSKSESHSLSTVRLPLRLATSSSSSSSRRKSLERRASSSSSHHAHQRVSSICLRLPVPECLSSPMTRLCALFRSWSRLCTSDHGGVLPLPVLVVAVFAGLMLSFLVFEAALLLGCAVLVLRQMEMTVTFHFHHRSNNNHGLPHKNVSTASSSSTRGHSRSGSGSGGGRIKHASSTTLDTLSESASESATPAASSSSSSSSPMSESDFSPNTQSLRSQALVHQQTSMLMAADHLALPSPVPAAAADDNNEQQHTLEFPGGTDVTTTTTATMTKDEPLVQDRSPMPVEGCRTGDSVSASPLCEADLQPLSAPSFPAPVVPLSFVQRRRSSLLPEEHLPSPLLSLKPVMPQSQSGVSSASASARATGLSASRSSDSLASLPQTDNFQSTAPQLVDESLRGVHPFFQGRAQLVSWLDHAIRNPLHAIIASADLMRSGSAEPHGVDSSLEEQDLGLGVETTTAATQQQLPAPKTLPSPLETEECLTVILESATAIQEILSSLQTLVSEHRDELNSSSASQQSSPTPPLEPQQQPASACSDAGGVSSDSSSPAGLFVRNTRARSSSDVRHAPGGCSAASMSLRGGAGGSSSAEESSSAASDISDGESKNSASDSSASPSCEEGQWRSSSSATHASSSSSATPSNSGRAALFPSPVAEEGSSVSSSGSSGSDSARSGPPTSSSSSSSSSHPTATGAEVASSSASAGRSGVITSGPDAGTMQWPKRADLIAGASITERMGELSPEPPVAGTVAAASAPHSNHSTPRSSGTPVRASSSTPRESSVDSAALAFDEEVESQMMLSPPPPLPGLAASATPPSSSWGRTNSGEPGLPAPSAVGAPAAAAAANHESAPFVPSVFNSPSVSHQQPSHLTSSVSSTMHARNNSAFPELGSSASSAFSSSSLVVPSTALSQALHTWSYPASLPASTASGATHLPLPIFNHAPPSHVRGGGGGAGGSGSGLGSQPSTPIQTKRTLRKTASQPLAPEHPSTPELNVAAIESDVKQHQQQQPPLQHAGSVPTVLRHMQQRSSALVPSSRAMVAAGNGVPVPSVSVTVPFTSASASPAQITPVVDVRHHGVRTPVKALTSSMEPAPAAGTAAPPSASPPVSASPATVSLQSSSLSSSSVDYRCCRVLVVDDSPINVKILSRMLTTFGLSVYTAADGLQAVEAVQKLAAVQGASASSSSSEGGGGASGGASTKKQRKERHVKRQQQLKQQQAAAALLAVPSPSHPQVPQSEPAGATSSMQLLPESAHTMSQRSFSAHSPLPPSRQLTPPTPPHSAQTHASKREKQSAAAAGGAQSSSSGNEESSSSSQGGGSSSDSVSPSPALSPSLASSSPLMLSSCVEGALSAAAGAPLAQPPATRKLTPWRAKRTFDLILTDINMPNMNGLESTRRIRSLEVEYGLGRVPVIAVTANSSEQDRAACAAAGCDYFVSKPFVRSDITTLVQQILRQAHEETMQGTSRGSGNATSTTSGRGGGGSASPPQSSSSAAPPSSSSSSSASKHASPQQHSQQQQQYLAPLLPPLPTTFAELSAAAAAAADAASAAAANALTERSAQGTPIVSNSDSAPSTEGDEDAQLQLPEQPIPDLGSAFGQPTPSFMRCSSSVEPSQWIGSPNSSSSSTLNGGAASRGAAAHRIAAHALGVAPAPPGPLEPMVTMLDPSPVDVSSSPMTAASSSAESPSSSRGAGTPSFASATEEE